MFNYAIIDINNTSFAKSESKFKVYLKECNKEEWVLVKSNVYAKDFPLSIYIDRYIGRVSCYNYKIEDQNNLKTYVGTNLFRTSTPTPTITPTPTTTKTINFIEFGSIYEDDGLGNIDITYTLISDNVFESDKKITFTNLLYRNNGDPVKSLTTVKFFANTKVGQTITKVKNTTLSDIKPYNSSIEIKSTNISNPKYDKYKFIEFIGKPTPELYILYIFKPCCVDIGLTPKNLLVPAEELSPGGWVNLGYGVYIDGYCYMPSEQGGDGSDGYYYGPDVKTCFDNKCLCITPTPTPTPTTTPLDQCECYRNIEIFYNCDSITEYCAPYLEFGYKKCDGNFGYVVVGNGNSVLITDCIIPLSVTTSSMSNNSYYTIDYSNVICCGAIPTNTPTPTKTSTPTVTNSSVLVDNIMTFQDCCNNSVIQVNIVNPQLSGNLPVIYGESVKFNFNGGGVFDTNMCYKFIEPIEYYPTIDVCTSIGTELYGSMVYHDCIQCKTLNDVICVSQTPTPTNNPTPTITPTNSLTPSLTNTITPTQSITPSLTQTVLPSTLQTFRDCCTQEIIQVNILYFEYWFNGFNIGEVGQIESSFGGGIFNNNSCYERISPIPYYPTSDVSGSITNMVYWSFSFSNCLLCQSYNPCGTNTPTPTQTVTVTPTNLTHTPTPTNTTTPTITPTITITQSVTPTITPTNTITNTITQTNTPTNTITQTNTPTNTITQTNTPTNTITQTNTPTNTITQTVNYLARFLRTCCDQQSHTYMVHPDVANIGSIFSFDGVCYNVVGVSSFASESIGYDEVYNNCQSCMSCNSYTSCTTQDITGKADSCCGETSDSIQWTATIGDGICIGDSFTYSGQCYTITSISGPGSSGIPITIDDCCPSPCPSNTPTPTQTITPTPTITPTLTPSISLTPTITPTNTTTPTNTITITQTITNTITPSQTSK